MENQVQETTQVAEQPVAPQTEQQTAAPASQEQQIETAQVVPTQENKLVFKGISTGYETNQKEEPQEQKQEQSQEQTQEQSGQQQASATQENESVIYRDESSEPQQVAKQEVDPFDLLGVREDDYFKKLVEAYKNDSLDEFLIKTNIDYDAISDQEIIKMQIESQYPTLAEEERNLLLQRKMNKEYNIGSEDESEDRVGKLLLKVEADKIREGLKKEQAEYTPSKNPNSVEARMQAQQEAQLKQIQEFQGYVKEHPATKQLETSRLLQYGVGDTKLNYEVNQGLNLSELAVDSNKFFQMFLGQDGKVDMNKFYKVANYAASMEGVEKALIAYGRSLGEKRLYDELKNTKISDNVTSAPSGSGFKIKSIDNKPFF
jgi:hypothetical protein